MSNVTTKASPKQLRWEGQLPFKKVTSRTSLATPAIRKAGRSLKIGQWRIDSKVLERQENRHWDGDVKDGSGGPSQASGRRGGCGKAETK